MVRRVHYDAYSNVPSDTDAAGGVTSYTRSTAEATLSVTDPRGDASVGTRVSAYRG